MLFRLFNDIIPRFEFFQKFSDAAVLFGNIKGFPAEAVVAVVGGGLETEDGAEEVVDLDALRLGELVSASEGGAVGDEESAHVGGGGVPAVVAAVVAGPGDRPAAALFDLPVVVGEEQDGGDEAGAPGPRLAPLRAIR